MRRHMGPSAPMTPAIGVGKAAQVMDTDAEAPFAGPDPGAVKLFFIVVFLGQDLRQHVAKRLGTGPVREEIAADHGVEDGRVPGQVLA